MGNGDHYVGLINHFNGTDCLSRYTALRSERKGSLMSYTIVQNLIPGLPKEVYDSGHYVGVVSHSTANNGDSADGERNYESKTWQSAFVHFFVDDTKIEQVADYNYVCYGAGHTANHMGYAQVELCQTTDATKFTKAYAMYTWLLAKLLYDRKLGVVDEVTLMSHAQVSAKWHETTHTDPCGVDGKSGYLGTHGKTWADVVRDVTSCYKSMAQPVTQPSAQSVDQLYRVRTSWQDVKSQVGAFHILQSAIITANQHPGTKVFNEDGQQVYPASVVYETVFTQSLPLMCRQAPNVKAPILGKFPKGTKVQVFSKTSTGWWEVGASGIRGWVAAQYLK